MKKFSLKQVVLTILIVVLSVSLYSQDLIVTSEGDSLNCKIIKINSDKIYFTFKYEGEIYSTLIPLGQVRHYQQNYYKTAIVSKDKVIDNEIYPYFSAAINGGWSYRTARLPDNIPHDFIQYVKDLRSGYHYGIDLSYYFSEHLGIGLDYYIYRSKNEIDNIYVIRPDGTTQYGKMSDDISIDFIAPFFSTRLLNSNKKSSLFVNLGIGYLGYKNETTVITDFTLKGSTLGYCWHIGYDIGISDNLAVRFQLLYITGTLREYEFSDGFNKETIKLEEGSYDNLNRIDLSIGLRFNK